MELTGGRSFEFSESQGAARHNSFNVQHLSRGGLESWELRVGAESWFRRLANVPRRLRGVGGECWRRVMFLNVQLSSAPAWRRRRVGVTKLSALLDAMFQLPDAESGEEKSFGSGEAAGGGEVGDIARRVGSGFGTSAWAARLGLASGGRFAHREGSTTIHTNHN